MSLLFGHPVSDGTDKPVYASSESLPSLAYKYDLQVVTKPSGVWTVATTLTPTARVEAVNYELNGLSTMSFSVPTAFLTPNVIIVDQSEVRLLQDGLVIFWGIVVRASGGWDKVTFQCVDVAWYFGKRLIGVTGKKNLILNGSFETGTYANWNPYDTSATVVSSHHFEGGYGLNLAQNTEGKEAFVEQIVTLGGSPNGGTTYVLIAWVHIRTDTFQSTLVPQSFGDAYQSRGLHMEIWKDAIYDTAHGKYIETVGAPLSVGMGHWMGQSHRLECQVFVPANATYYAAVRLYSPKGDVVWDNVQLYSVDAFVRINTDPVTVVDDLVQYAQNPLYGKVPNDISCYGTPTGKQISVGYKYTDKVRVLDAIKSVASNTKLLDWSMVYTDQTRQLRLWPGKKGTRKDNFPIVSGTNVVEIQGAFGTENAHFGEIGWGFGGSVDGTTNSVVSNFDFTFDGEQGANYIYALSEYDGMLRDEALAKDPTVFGGNVLEDVVVGGSEDTKMSLQTMADKKLAKTRDGAMALTVDIVPGCNYMKNIDVGDYVPVNIVRGWFALNEYLRIVRKTIYPATGAMQIVLNRDSDTE